MFEIIPPHHSLRSAVEETIRAAFLREHGARLDILPRVLVAVTDSSGIVCAASLRFSNDGFFSERYLDGPIENLVGSHAGMATNRQAMVEVGSLAAARPGQVVPLIQGIISHLQANDVRWAFFTATARLRAFLRRGGISLIELTPADPERIANPEEWGGYYRQDPRVMLVGDYMLGNSGESLGLGETRCQHA